MKEKRLPRCPHCGHEVDYLIALSEKQKGEHQCTVCKRKSRIRYGRRTYRLAWRCGFISFIMMTIFLLFAEDAAIYGLFFVLLPFLFFYMKVPYQMILEREQRSSQRGKKQEKDDLGATRVVDLKGQTHKGNERVRINSIERIPISKTKEEPEEK